MKLLVLGASGRTGRHVVKQAVARGLEVTAFTRKSAQFPGCRVVEGDGLDRQAIKRALAGQDAVIAIVATDNLCPTQLASQVTRNIVVEMRSAGIRRLVITSTRSTTATRPRPLLRLLWATFMFPYIDAVRQETIVEESGLDWTIVRAARLTDKPGRGMVHIDNEADPTGGDPMLPRSDFASAILDATLDPTLVGRAIGVNGATRAMLKQRAA